MWGTASISLATLILISIAVLFSSEAKIPRETNVKEGNCPKVHISEGHECPIPPDLQDMDAFNEFLKSVAECVVDADCNGTHKCCFDGCKTLCVSMKHGDKQLARQGDQLSSQRNQLFGSKKNRPKSDFIRPQSRLRKQGKCPLAKQPTEGCQWTPEHKLGYSISCETDEDCEETEGCCFDGCHFRCSELPNVDPSASSEDSGAKNGVGEKPRSIHWTLYLPERTADPVKSQTEKETVIPENKERKEESSTEDSENVNMNRRSDPKDERTFVKIWPSGVKRGLVGEIIRRFERKGCAIVGIKVATVGFEIWIIFYEWISDMKESLPRGGRRGY